MRKRDRRDSFICSCTPVGARETTTVTGPKRKSGKRTAVPLNWEVLQSVNVEGLGIVYGRLYTRFTPPSVPGVPHPSLTQETCLLVGDPVLTDRLEPPLTTASVTDPDPESLCVCPRVCACMCVCVCARRHDGACARKAVLTSRVGARRVRTRGRRFARAPSRAFTCYVFCVL